jgi:hypothetical protein
VNRDDLFDIQPEAIVGVVTVITVFLVPRTVSTRATAFPACAALMNPCGVNQICVVRPSTAVRMSRSIAAGAAFWPTTSHATGR